MGASGDREAWNRVLKRLRPIYMKILLSRRVDPDLAEDVVQDTLAAIWSRLNTLRDIDRFSSWALSILLNRLRSLQARRWRERQLPPTVPAPHARDPLQGLLAHEGTGWILKAMEKLPARQQAVVRLRIIQGLSIKCASETLGMPRPRFRRRLHEGLKGLRGTLLRWEERVAVKSVAGGKRKHGAKTATCHRQPPERSAEGSVEEAAEP